MEKGRLEAFSDAVIAIIITIMVLELDIPHGDQLSDLRDLIPVFLTYVLSFVYLGIYWNNHHHLIQASGRISSGTLWANLNLLFWLSLFPFATGWMGENHVAEVPTAFYGCVLLLAAIAYFTLQTVIVRSQGAGSPIKAALGSDAKGKISPILYALGIGFAFIQPWVSIAIYTLVAAIWLVPDRRLIPLITREDSADESPS